MMEEEMQSHHSKALENRNKGITPVVIEKVKSYLSKLSWLWAGGSQELCFTQPLPKGSNSSLHPWSLNDGLWAAAVELVLTFSVHFRALG